MTNNDVGSLFSQAFEDFTFPLSHSEVKEFLDGFWMYSLGEDDVAQESIDRVVKAYLTCGDLVTLKNAISDGVNFIGSDGLYHDFTAIKMINVSFVDICEMEGLAPLLSKISENKEILRGVPDLSLKDIARMSVNGHSLVRSRSGRINSDKMLDSVSINCDVAKTFFTSAALTGDLEAIEHLNLKSSFRSQFNSRDMEFLCKTIVDFSNSSQMLYNRVARNFDVSGVLKSYSKKRAFSDYMDSIINYVCKPECSANIFDLELSKKSGPTLISSLLDVFDQTIKYDEVTRRNKILSQHILNTDGSHMAFLEARYGRVGALDYVDDPINKLEVIDYCLDQENRLDFFLCMFSIDELLQHDKGQDCLRRVFEMTRDPKVLEKIDSLEFKGQAFHDDLGL